MGWADVLKITDPHHRRAHDFELFLDALYRATALIEPQFPFNDQTWIISDTHFFH